MQEPWVNWLLEQLLILGSHVGLFLILTLVLFALQRAVFLLSKNMLGGRVIYISAWVGTPIHELSHAFFCLIFGHKIKHLVLFKPDKHGTLGFVSHSYNNRNLWQVMGNFFIGIAPLFGGLLAIYLLTSLLLDDPQPLFKMLKMAAFNDIDTLHFLPLLELNNNIIAYLQNAYARSPLNVVIWAYLCAAVSLHLCPSKEDLKGAWAGFIVFIALCLSLMMLNQTLDGNYFAGFKNTINMSSMLYVIGIVLASGIVLFLLMCKVISLVFKR
ncbi:MAG: hypothetical protein ACJAZP_002682 [Psychromonas sp.]|jgi:hypothetical protein|uniref:hypothetical protein n=1 Tax=Psychromonas sp. TaxID=1884585 RepID=UPI0039E380D1